MINQNLLLEQIEKDNKLTLNEGKIFTLIDENFIYKKTNKVLMKALKKQKDLLRKSQTKNRVNCSKTIIDLTNDPPLVTPMILNYDDVTVEENTGNFEITTAHSLAKGFCWIPKGKKVG